MENATVETRAPGALERPQAPDEVASLAWDVDHPATVGHHLEASAVRFTA